MSYTYYCFGLAAQAVDSELTEEDAAAYAIGSLDRLHKVKLPRCRKEVEDAIAALSDPKNHCGNNLVCAGFATQSETPSAAQQWQERCNRLQAERDNYHSLLDAAEDARKRADMPIVVDGSLTFMQMKKDYIEAFGADNYGVLRQHIDAHTRRADGSLDADLATLILFTTMKYHIANKAK